MQHRLDTVPKERRGYRDSSLRAMRLGYKRYPRGAPFRMTGGNLGAEPEMVMPESSSRRSVQKTGGNRLRSPKRVSGFRNHPSRDGWGCLQAVMPQPAWQPVPQ